MHQISAGTLRLFLAGLLVALCTFAGSARASVPSVAWTVVAHPDPVVLDTRPIFLGGRTMTVDSAGNAYVTGTVYDVHDVILTIKYRPDGSEMWRAVSDGSASGISVDSAGSVYVAGKIQSPAAIGPDTDFLAVKYDANGAESWRARAHGVANGQDSARALAVDTGGNVYVTGQVDAGILGATPKVLTIKYDTTGGQQWRSTAIVGSYLDAVALKVDGTGSVYVLASDADGFGGHYVTIKYNAVGVEQWRAMSSVQAIPKALAVDASGNVYASGWNSSGTLTIKYSTTGVAQWEAVASPMPYLPVPNAIEVDAGGNLYVAGQTGNGSCCIFDSFTVKYSPGGAELWRASGGLNGLDYRAGAYALALDLAGAAYITGSTGSGENDFVTIKYDAAGSEVWRSISNGSASSTDVAYAIGLDGTGNVYVSGLTDVGGARDCLTIKYDNGGTEQWRATSGESVPALLPAAPLAMFPRQPAAVDVAGNVYVTGTTFNGHDDDYFIGKFDAQGNEIWRVQADAAGAGDQAAAVALDAGGNVYVTGLTHAPNGTISEVYQGLIIKFDQNGVEQWRVFDNSPFQQAVAVDSSGNVYTASDEGFRTIKYDTNGVEQWRATADPKGGVTGVTPYAIALGSDGSVYVAGSGGVLIGLGAYPVVFTVKYDANGAEQWRAAAQSATPGINVGYALALDAVGNVYVTGTLADATGRMDYVTLKYDAHGIEQWRELANGPGTDNAYAYAVAVDASGNVYVTGGASSAIPQAHDYLTVKYNSSGVQLWRAATNRGANGDDFAYGLAVDASGNVYVTGTGFNGDNFDALTIRYSASGAEQWRTTGTNPLDNDFAYSIALGPANSVYIAGKSTGPTTPTGIMVQKLIQGGPTTTNLASLANPSNIGQLVTFTATVAGNAPTGTIDFSDGAIPICTGVPIVKTRTGGRYATCSSSSLAIGPHTITAVYAGDSNNLGSTSLPLNQVVTLPPPGVSLTSSLNPSTLGNSVTFTANVTGQTPTGTVTFKNGTSALCSAVPLQGGGNTPVATCTTSALTRGLHSITAAYSGDANNVAATSPVLTQSVKRPRR